ncbi:MAG TPA: HAD-IC family P-type ATPase [Patescibacteria group bacterium]|nr:HAD-IC family P-type ATPase [Patescibacteria group bacterium]
MTDLVADQRREDVRAVSVEDPAATLGGTTTNGPGAAAVAAPNPAGPDLPATPPDGLTDAEAERRRANGLGNTAPPATTRSYRQIVVENVFTFINNILIALAIGLIAVGRPMDALVSVAVIATNVVVGIVQEVRAKRTLDRIALLTRPTANVVRAGAIRAVAMEELVVGDLVEMRAGDQVVLDGRLASGALGMDESLLTGESDVVRKQPGDEVFSGSFATTGGGRYVAEKVQNASLANQITAGARTFRRVLTPLQQEINLVIRVVLGIVVYLEVLLLIRGALRGVAVGALVSDATLLAGLVPNGLFVSIAVAYAVAAIRILRFGALVQQANAVESLSHVDVLCLDKTGTLTANHLEVEAVTSLGDADEEAVVAALAALAGSATAHNRTSEAIAARWPANPRPLVAEAPFSSVRKWSAAAFGIEDGAPGGGPSGVVALGAAPFLRPYLARDADDQPAGWAELEAAAGGWTARGLRVLLVSTHPDPAGLRPGTDDAEATLPDGMRALGLVALRDELRADAADTLARFVNAGVAVKVISGDDPDTVVSLARQAGLTGELRAVSGRDLDDADDDRLGRIASETTIFGRITPAQKERLVDALRRDGHYVAMIGDGVNDVLSLKKANLAIAMGSGSQATRGVADMVLIEDTFGAVARAVEEGQRIVNGMQDILKLFLTRVATVGLVVISSLVVGAFPIDLRNASALTIFTVGIPSTLLAVWAAPGRRHQDSLARTLATFVVPAAVVSSLLGLVVFYGSVAMAGAHDPAGVEVAGAEARTAFTSFLVFAGLFLVVFVEPPIEWLAVIEPRTADRRPTLLAAVLALGYTATLVVPAARDFFAFAVPGPRETALALGAALLWVPIMRTFWRRKLIERFIGAVGAAA